MVIFSLVFYMPVQFQTFNIPCLKKILVIIVHKAVLRKACGQYYISYNYLVKFNDLLRFHTHKILFMQEITGHINSTCSKEIRIENIFANVKVELLMNLKYFISLIFIRKFIWFINENWSNIPQSGEYKDFYFLSLPLIFWFTIVSI